MKSDKCNILIVIAHPDDETLGMGGTINKHANKGDEVFVISMTNGVGSRDGINYEKIKERELAGIKASEKLGFSWYKRYDFPDNSMDKYPLLDYVKCIEAAKREIAPEIVYTHSAADLNIDHRKIAEAVITSFRPEPKEICREIRLFEIPSATDYSDPSLIGNFIPNLFIDIKNNWLNKLEALNCYKAELRSYPHTRSVESIENLAKRRGNQVGIEMAEAFQIIRSIKKNI